MWTESLPAVLHGLGRGSSSIGYRRPIPNSAGIAVVTLRYSAIQAACHPAHFEVSGLLGGALRLLIFTTRDVLLYSPRLFRTHLSGIHSRFVRIKLELRRGDGLLICVPRHGLVDTGDPRLSHGELVRSFTGVGLVLNCVLCLVAALVIVIQARFKHGLVWSCCSFVI